MGADEALSDRVFSEIEGQGQRMTLLIQKLLLLTRLESQEPRDIKILDVAEIATSVVDSFLPLAGESTLSMRGDTVALVKMSESELRDILGNLLDNAIKYAPGSAVDVAVQQRGASVHVTISDNGPGMSPELRARVFERFSRGETAGSIPGSGLGLAIVETAVERTGGVVTLRTAPGQGTTVELRFPAWQESERST
jgi:signal transduction histidine kinase